MHVYINEYVIWGFLLPKVLGGVNANRFNFSSLKVTSGTEILCAK